jgi:Immunity protein 40
LDFLDFAGKTGFPLSTINPGSNEFALEYKDALLGLEILKKFGVAILGGDILTMKSGELIYSYQVWGDEYHYLNWHCDKIKNESEQQYLFRSFTIARESLENANKIAHKFDNPCYIVFVSK